MMSVIDMDGMTYVSFWACGMTTLLYLYSEIDRMYYAKYDWFAKYDPRTYTEITLWIITAFCSLTLFTASRFVKIVINERDAAAAERDAAVAQRDAAAADRRNMQRVWDNIVDDWQQFEAFNRMRSSFIGRLCFVLGLW